MDSINIVPREKNIQYTRDKKEIESEIADLKQQIKDLSRDIYGKNSSAETKPEITQKELASLCQGTEKTAVEKKGISSGVKMAAAAVAGLATGYVAGEIHKNMEAAKNVTPTDESNPKKGKAQRAIPKKDIIHKSFEQFEIDNNILQMYHVSHTEYGMIDVNKNYCYDKHPEGHGLFSFNRSTATVDDEPRLDIPLNKLQDFYRNNRDRVAYAGYITKDDIGEIGTHREKVQNGVTTLFDRKTLTEVLRELHPGEKEINWAFHCVGGKLFAFKPA